MCHDKANKSLIKVTGSSNPGHAVCCKPGYNGEHCVTNDETICSEPTQKTDNEPDMHNIFTDGKNQQMFAFCPRTTAALCGVSSDTTEDDPNKLIIKATKDV